MAGWVLAAGFSEKFGNEIRVRLVGLWVPGVPGLIIDLLG